MLLLLSVGAVVASRSMIFDGLDGCPVGSDTARLGCPVEGDGVGIPVDVAFVDA